MTYVMTIILAVKFTGAFPVQWLLIIFYMAANLFNNINCIESLKIKYDSIYRAIPMRRNSIDMTL